jgi:Carboxypeptidase regulatory-like domain
MPHPAGAALALAAALLYAAACQRFPKGRIEGTVRDRSGAPIAGVGVYVAGLAHSGLSDTSGRYRLPSVPVSTHRLRATAIGYVPLERDSVVVQKGVTTRVDFMLDRMWPGLGLPSTPGPDRATILANGAAIGWRRNPGCRPRRSTD